MLLLQTNRIIKLLMTEKITHEFILIIKNILNKTYNGKELFHNDNIVISEPPSSNNY